MNWARPWPIGSNPRATAPMFVSTQLEGVLWSITTQYQNQILGQTATYCRSGVGHTEDGGRASSSMTPGTMDDQTRKLLRRIIDSGPASGAFVILLQTGDRVDRTSSRNAFDERTPEEIDDEFYLEDKLNLITLDERTDDAVLCLPQGDLTIRPVGGMNHLSVQELIGQVATLQSQQTGPVVGPERLLPEGGTASAAQGIEVNIGDRENGSPLKFELRSANPPRSNALIGGAVGTGKSNLLHTLVYSIAAKYRREEVEMMLLDFKSGTEFQRYARQSNSAGGTRNWLPNARLVGLESDRAFGLSVLEELLVEMDRRAEAFKAAGTVTTTRSGLPDS